MAYLDSTQFPDKLSYKILFVLSYGLEDINFASFKHFLQFSENRKEPELFSPRGY
jgi:hypothetical protein